MLVLLVLAACIEEVTCHDSKVSAPYQRGPQASFYAPGWCSAKIDVDQRFVVIPMKDQNIDTPYMKWNR